MELFRRSSALQYSIPRILFGDCSILKDTSEIKCSDQTPTEIFLEKISVMHGGRAFSPAFTANPWIKALATCSWKTAIPAKSAPPRRAISARRCFGMRAGADKIPARADHYNQTKNFLGITDLIFMPFVKWIVFCNDSNNFHIKTCHFSKYLAKHSILSGTSVFP